MSKNQTSNLPVSVKQKLLNISRERGEDANAVLMQYAIERFLYRLSKSRYSDEFLLKGAMLFAVWTDMRYRPTMDVDLLGRGQDSEESVREAISQIAATPSEDGLRFDSSTVRMQEIRENQRYRGRRVHITAYLGKARIPIQIDIGFGDAVSEEHATVEFPSLLNLPTPKLQAYSREELVAEKFDAMVNLGMLNSRLKDYFDIWVLSEDFAFGGKSLAQAIEATFKRRQTPLPTMPPVGLSEEFSADTDKKRQWTAFLHKVTLEKREDDLGGVVSRLAAFLMPPALAVGPQQEFNRNWHPGGSWHNAH